MKTSQRGINLIKEFEGFRGTAYRDPVGIWTIGYGFVKGVKQGDTITRAQADARLRRELAEYERAVERATGGNATQPQFDALVSFAYNVGVKGMAGSTVIKRHNAGDHQAAARAFGLWNKAGGKVWPGLTRRRAAEAALYLTPDPASQPVENIKYAMPAEVEPERSLAQSEISRASFVTGGTAAVATVAEVTRSVADIKYGMDSLMDWIVPVLLAVVVGLSVYIFVQRRRQREQGWS